MVRQRHDPRGFRSTVANRNSSFCNCRCCWRQDARGPRARSRRTGSTSPDYGAAFALCNQEDRYESSE